MSKSVSSGVAYYQEGEAWEADVYRRARRSRTLAWVVAAGFGVVAIGSLGCLALLLPLKTFEPYMVIVDRSTGYVEIARPLSKDRLPEPEREAVVAASAVRYLRARETYDPNTLKDDFELAQLLSSGEASRSLAEEYAPSNPKNLVKLYGRDTIVTVTVKSLSILNENTVQVRFATVRKDNQSTVTQHWVSIIRYRLLGAPIRNDWRWDNPLGFQVIDYRRDQEAVAVDQGAGQ